MKFLVLGSNGMAGHVISLYLFEKGYDVIGFAREKSKLVPSIVGDVRDTEMLKGIVSAGNFDVVVNAVGILNQFAENNHSTATFINGFLPHYLAEITADSPTRVFHMSTDCVFSGKSGGYTEESFPDGETFYDRSKAMGELKDNKNLTLRNSIVGPDLKQSGIGLMNWFLQQDGPEIKGYTKAIWTGQTTLQLAKTMERAAIEGATGLINAVPPTSISKFELLNMFNDYILHGEKKIIAVDGVGADKSLKRTVFSFAYEIPDYKTMISELAQWMKSHKTLYPHYKL